MKGLVKEFTKGLWKEIPPFRLVLGLCPTLAVTKSLEGGWGMGLATTFVLVCSNLFISALRNVIPPKVRINLHRDHRHLRRDHRACHEGLHTDALGNAGRLHTAHCGQLHHPRQG